MTSGFIWTGIGAAAGCAVAALLLFAIRGRQAPRRPKPVDPAIVGAVAAAVSSRYPGARVTRIEAEP